MLVDGRFIRDARPRPRVRVTFWILVERGSGGVCREAHAYIVFRYTAVCASPSPSSCRSTRCLFYSFLLQSPSTPLATVRRASHAGRYRCPFDLPRSSRVRKSASVARPSRSRFSRSVTALLHLRSPVLFSARNGRPLRTLSPSLRVLPLSQPRRTCIAWRENIGKDLKEGDRITGRSNVRRAPPSLSLSLRPCTPTCACLEYSSVTESWQTEPPGKTHLVTRSLPK